MSLGNLTICGLATEQYDDSGQIDWGDSLHCALRSIKIFALVKAEGDLFSAYAIEIDCFGLSNTTN